MNAIEVVGAVEPPLEIALSLADVQSSVHPVLKSVNPFLGGLDGVRQIGKRTVLAI